jgi:hypothetical protein
MKNKNKNKKDYTAIVQCGSIKYKKSHYIKATISSDSQFEDRLEKLMSCEHPEISIEYV